MEGRPRPELCDYDGSVAPSGTSTAPKSANLPSVRIQNADDCHQFESFRFFFLRHTHRVLRIALLPRAVSKKSERRTSDAMCRFPSPSVVFRTSWLSSVPSLYACL